MQSVSHNYFKCTKNNNQCQHQWIHKIWPWSFCHRANFCAKKNIKLLHTVLFTCNQESSDSVIIICIKDVCMETSNSDPQTLVNSLCNRLDMNVNMFDYTGYQNKIWVWCTAVTEVWRSKVLRWPFLGK